MKIEIENYEEFENKVDIFKVEITKIALDKFKGNKTYAANFIGISKRQFTNWFKDFPELNKFKVQRHRGSKMIKIEPVTNKIMIEAGCNLCSNSKGLKRVMFDSEVYKAKDFLIYLCEDCLRLLKKEIEK